MPVNHVAENVLGTMGTVCWTVQLLPQIWHTYRSKATQGLSEWLLLLWGVAGAFLGTYSIVQNLNIPLMVQPQLFGSLSLVVWAQCQYYGRKRSKTVSIAMFVTAIAIFAGFQVGTIFAIRPGYNAGKTAAVQFFGIFTTVVASLALFPQYYEIYKHKEVIGISITFMTIDLLGGVFNDLSLAFKGKFVVIAGVTYSLVVFLDGIVILLALILNPMAKRRRQRLAAAAEENSVDTASPPAETISESVGDSGVPIPDHTSHGNSLEDKADCVDVEKGTTICVT